MQPINPIMLDVKEQLETERLLLRLPLPGDGAEVNQAMLESLEELRPWLIWANRPQSPEETEALMRQCHIRFKERTELRFHGYSKETGELAFVGGLHRIDWMVRRVELGYWLRSRYAGQGLAFEAAQAMERLAIEVLGMDRIELQIEKGNTRSARLAERMGYTHEATMRGYQWNATLTAKSDIWIYTKVRGYEF